MKTWCVPKHGYRPDITYMSVLSPRRAPSKHGVTISMGSTSLQCRILYFKNLFRSTGSHRLVIAFLYVVAPKRAVCDLKWSLLMLVLRGFGGPAECPWA